MHGGFAMVSFGLPRRVQQVHPSSRPHIMFFPCSSALAPSAPRTP
jgi:hypothetical protein